MKKEKIVLAIGIVLVAIAIGALINVTQIPPSKYMEVVVGDGYVDLPLTDNIQISIKRICVNGKSYQQYVGEGNSSDPSPFVPSRISAEMLVKSKSKEEYNKRRCNERLISLSVGGTMILKDQVTKKEYLVILEEVRSFCGNPEIDAHLWVKQLL